MEVKIVKVGNSKGVIIPSKFFSLLGLKEKVNLNIDGNKIIITPTHKNSREGWDEMIKNEVEKNGQPERLLPDFFDDEKHEWEW